MIDPARFVEGLTSNGVELFTGVPDSLLKSFCAYVVATLPERHHIVAANEGAAVGIALGHHLRTGQPALVYLQNSGFGNTVNPLLSLADPEVYGVPMVLLIGWRGQPGVSDEPQHVKQGRVMTDLLDALEIPWAVLPRDEGASEQCVKEAIAAAIERPGPYAILVEKGTFAAGAGSAADTGREGERPSREDALVAVVDAIGNDAIHVSTTGKLSRELFEYRERRNQSGERDFLTVGGMGHASSIALGIATAEPEREVWCLDGDGAILMHLGSLAVIASHAPRTFHHVVFNNGVHDSVGGQPTAIDVVDVPGAALALGYRYAARIEQLDDLPEAVTAMRREGGPSLLEVRVAPGSRSDLGRPTRTPREAKHVFMTNLGSATET